MTIPSWRRYRARQPLMHRRLPSFVARALLACLPVLGLVMVAGAGSASAAPTPASTRAAALTALKHLLLGVHGTDHAVLGHLPVTHDSTTKVNSPSWSGYADTGTTFTQVSGNWVEPAVTCTSTETLAAFWVGFDGITSQTVEQAGTLAFCYDGAASYYTWWEMFPTNAIQLVGATVKPGDHISASVVNSSGTYALTVTDATTSGNNLSESETCGSTPCADSSAEWIAQATAMGGSVVPLADFGTWRVKSAAVTGGGTSGTISSFATSKITMVDSGGVVQAKPGALNPKGKSFKVVWKAST